MKRIFMVCLMVLFSANSVLALRCGPGGKELINEGDSKTQVLLRCGEPFLKETIGYIDHTLSGKRIRVMKIEQFVYKIREWGTTYVYTLVFEGNELIDITFEGKMTGVNDGKN